MARLYADEQFPRAVSQLLRTAIVLAWQPELMKRFLLRNVYKVISLEWCVHQVKWRSPPP